MKVAQSCPTLCDPMDYSVHGILQARILDWVTFPFSGGLPNPGIEPRSSALQADSLPAEPRDKESTDNRGDLDLLPGLGIWESKMFLLPRKGCHLRCHTVLNS